MPYFTLQYDVLLILTDGVVSDFDLTVERIIAASKKVPLSIIIIGIGRRNFRRMNELDSDDKLLTSADGNRQAARGTTASIALPRLHFRFFSDRLLTRLLFFAICVWNQQIYVNLLPSRISSMLLRKG